MRRIVKRVISIAVAAAVCSGAAFTSFAAGNEVYRGEETCIQRA